MNPIRRISLCVALAAVAALPLAQVADAWRRQASGQAGVRLVLTP